MRFLPASFFFALVFSGCTDPNGPRSASEMISDDLEPAVTQMTSGRSGVDRDPDLSREF